MLTPNEIQNKKFEKKMGGYRTEEVEAFLAEIAGYMLELQDEKNDLEKKLSVLAEKLEEYREDEESLRAALIGAQKLGDSVVRDAKRKAEMLVAEATMKAEEMIADAKNSIDKEALALSRMQGQVSEFRTKILGLYMHHMEVIKQIPEEAVLPADVKLIVDNAVAGEKAAEAPRFKGKHKKQAAPLPEEEPAGEFVLQYEDDDLAMEMPGEEEAPVHGKEERSHHRRSEFGNLRFGEEYNLTRKD